MSKDDARGAPASDAGTRAPLRVPARLFETVLGRKLTRSELKGLEIFLAGL